MCIANARFKRIVNQTPKRQWFAHLKAYYELMKATSWKTRYGIDARVPASSFDSTNYQDQPASFPDVCEASLNSTGRHEWHG